MKKAIVIAMLLLITSPLISQEENEHWVYHVDYAKLQKEVNLYRAEYRAPEIYFDIGLSEVAEHHTTAMVRTFYGHEATSQETKEMLTEKYVDVDDWKNWRTFENVAILYSEILEMENPEREIARVYSGSPTHNSSILSPLTEAMGWSIQFDREDTYYYITTYVLMRRRYR